MPDETTRTGTLYYYNAFGQATVIDYPSDDTHDIRFTYDLDGNVTQIVRGNVTLKYTYNKIGQRTSEALIIVETDSNNKKTSKTYKGTYVYDSTGGLIKYTSPSGKIFSFTVNAFNQPTGLSVGSTKYISNAKYHVSGILKSAQLHSTVKSRNNQTMEFENSFNNRLLVSKTLLEYGKTTLMSFSNTYDKSGRVSAVSNLSSDNSIGDRNFTFDKMNQLKSAVVDGKNISYTYDLFENILSQTKKSESFVNEYNATSNLVKKSTETKTGHQPDTRVIKHDAKGRIERVGEKSFTYDDANNIIVSKQKSGDELDKTVLYEHRKSYDGNGNRVFISKNYVYGVSESKKTTSQNTRKEYHATFLNGKFKFRSITEKNPVVNQRVEDEPLGDKEAINFGRFITLQIDECTRWVVTNHTNNNRVVLNTDNTLGQHISLDPYGNRSKDDGTYKQCKTDVKPTNPSPPPSTAPSQPNTPEPGLVPKPPKNKPPYPIPYNPYLDENTSVASNSSLVTNNTRKHIFQGVYKDNGSGLYFLDSKRYYDSQLGRHLTPFATDLSKIKVQNLNSNKFSIASNNPVNLFIEETENIFTAKTNISSEYSNDNINQNTIDFYHSKVW